jgi:hypothetical protein
MYSGADNSKGCLHNDGGTLEENGVGASISNNGGTAH